MEFVISNLLCVQTKCTGKSCCIIEYVNIMKSAITDIRSLVCNTEFRKYQGDKSGFWAITALMWRHGLWRQKCIYISIHVNLFT